MTNTNNFLIYFGPYKTQLMSKKQLDMCTGPHSSLLILGDRKLVNKRLQHPFETMILCELPEAKSITYADGVVFACGNHLIF